MQCRRHAHNAAASSTSGQAACLQQLETVITAYVKWRFIIRYKAMFAVWPAPSMGLAHRKGQDADSWCSC
jgi:hypothetical protein